MKLSGVLFALLILLVAFATIRYGLSPDLRAQVTGTVSISVGSSTTSSTTFTATVSSTLTATSTTSSTLTTDNTSTIGDGGDSATTTSTNIPELQIGPIVLAFAIGLALVMCRKHRN